MIYILDAENNVIASCNKMPSQADLDTRNERAIHSNVAIPAGEAKLVSGEITRKPNPAVPQKVIEMKKIYSRMFKNTAAELQAEGEITHPDLVNYKDKVEKMKGGK